MRLSRTTRPLQTNNQRDGHHSCSTAALRLFVSGGTFSARFDHWSSCPLPLTYLRQRRARERTVSEIEHENNMLSIVVFRRRRTNQGLRRKAKSKQKQRTRTKTTPHGSVCQGRSAGIQTPSKLSGPQMSQAKRKKTPCGGGLHMLAIVHLAHHQHAASAIQTNTSTGRYKENTQKSSVQNTYSIPQVANKARKNRGKKTLLSMKNLATARTLHASPHVVLCPRCILM